MHHVLHALIFRRESHYFIECTQPINFCNIEHFTSIFYAGVLKSMVAHLKPGLVTMKLRRIEKYRLLAKHYHVSIKTEYHAGWISCAERLGLLLRIPFSSQVTIWSFGHCSPSYTVKWDLTSQDDKRSPYKIIALQTWGALHACRLKSGERFTCLFIVYHKKLREKSRLITTIYDLRITSRYIM